MERKMEEWRQVVGYEGIYEVSSFGNVRRNGRKLANLDNGNGYKQAALHCHGIQKRYCIHRLVARAFIGPRNDGMEINHKNGDRTDNRLSNLEYVSHSENMKHAYRVICTISRVGECNGTASLTENDVREIRLCKQLGLSQAAIGRKFDVHRSTIFKVVHGKTWAHVQ